MEMACLLGTPTKEDYTELNRIVDPNLLSVVFKMGDIPKMDLKSILKLTHYSERDVLEAADLIEKMV